MNATVGVNTVIRSVDWQRGDVALCFSTVYHACGAALAWAAERYGIEVNSIEIQHPLSSKDILRLTEERIQSLKKSGKTVKLLLFDAISSMPSVVVPW